MKCPHCKKQIKFIPSDLTKREQEIYEYIVSYTVENNESPMYKEIIDFIGVSKKSKGYIARLLRQIESKGYIRLVGGHRGIEVL